MRISNKIIQRLLPNLVKISCEYRQPIRMGCNHEDYPNPDLHIFIGKPFGNAIWGILSAERFAISITIIELSHEITDDVRLVSRAFTDIIKDHKFD